MILDIIFIVIAGRYFMQLADTYNKSKWGYAVLGVVTGYAAILIGGLLVGIIYGVLYGELIELGSQLLLGLIAIIIGGLSSYALYTYLEKKWKRERDNEMSNLDDLGKS